MIRKSEFRPACWLRNPHLQTVWAARLRRTRPVRWQRERVELPDGDFLDLALTADNGGPIVLLLHGLAGSVHSHYATGLLGALEQRGYRGVLMHFRACSGEVNRLPRLYHQGETSDPAFIIDLLRARHPDRPLAAAGISLGGNVLLKLLGEQGDQCKLDAAVGVSVPMQLENCADQLDRGLSKFYQWRLIRELKETVREKRRCNQLSELDMKAVMASRTFWEFDDRATAPLHGFKDVHEYYRLSSSRQYLINIRKPTLIIHALDDPFIAPEAIPEEQELSPAVTLELSRHGGHAGFVGGKYPWDLYYWLDRRIPDFLDEQLAKDE